MRNIHVFTEDYRDVLAQTLLETNLHSFDGLVEGLADVATQIMCKGDKNALKAEFGDFLSQNDYIHLDAFIRICLEDIDA